MLMTMTVHLLLCVLYYTMPQLFVVCCYYLLLLFLVCVFFFFSFCLPKTVNGKKTWLSISFAFSFQQSFSSFRFRSCASFIQWLNLNWNEWEISRGRLTVKLTDYKFFFIFHPFDWILPPIIKSETKETFVNTIILYFS